jgi:hypothetical protein
MCCVLSPAVLPCRPPLAGTANSVAATAGSSSSSSRQAQLEQQQQQRQEGVDEGLAQQIAELQLLPELKLNDFMPGPGGIAEPQGGCTPPQKLHGLHTAAAAAAVRGTAAEGDITADVSCNQSSFCQYCCTWCYCCTGWHAPWVNRRLTPGQCSYGISTSFTKLSLHSQDNTAKQQQAVEPPRGPVQPVPQVVATAPPAAPCSKVLMHSTTMKFN